MIPALILGAGILILILLHVTGRMLTI